MHHDAEKETQTVVNIQPAYRPRFVAASKTTELVNLYHLARTALAGGDDSPYRRMIWAAKEFSKANPGTSENGAYKDLCGLLDR